MIFGLVIGELRVLCNVEAFFFFFCFLFFLLTRERISDRTGKGLLSQTFRHDILQNKIILKRHKFGENELMEIVAFFMK